MKIIVISLVAFFFCITGYSQETATVYFIRNANHSGSLIKYKVLSNDELLCSLKNGKYTTHDIVPGEKIFLLQPYKDDAKNEKASATKATIEAGKTYYFSVSWTPYLQFVEIDKLTGEKLISKMKLQTDCKPE